MMAPFSATYPAGVRLAYSHVVVLDSFFGEPEREALLSQLTQPGWDHSKVGIKHHMASCLLPSLALNATW